MNWKDVRMPWAAIGDNVSRSMAKSVFGKSQTMKDFGSEERAFGSEWAPEFGSPRAGMQNCVP